MTDQSFKKSFLSYPKTIQGPKTPYSFTPGSNPVLSGLPLVIAGAAASSISHLAGLLWSNAGFGNVRKVPGLDDYEPRYDPTVIPTSNGSTCKAYESQFPDFSYGNSPNVQDRGTSIADYHDAYKAGETTPTKVAEAVLALAEERLENKTVFLSIKKDQIIAAAEASTRRYKEGKAKGLLDGVPLAIKDEVDLEGHFKCHGSVHVSANEKDTTSWCVQKWQEAGAIIIGKLNMHELGLDTSGNNPTTGTPSNPHNPSYYPGGSSSASATTVASNLFPLTLGCDGGGSIRIPSTYCGIYGLKPSHGRVGRTPTPSLCLSTTVAGPMAGNMADLELGYRIMAAPDPGDKASMLFAPPVPQATPADRKVLGVCRAWFDVADPAVLNACYAALSHYEARGWKVVDIDLPYLHEGQLAHAMTILAESGSGVSPSDMHKFSAPNKIFLAIASQTPAPDFLQAQKLRNLLMSHLAHLFTQYPGLLIVTPTTPNAGWPIDSPAELTRGLSNANMSVRNMTYVWLANFSGCPAISIPVGFAEGKKGAGEVPVGMMAMGEWGDEEGLLEWGRVGEEWAWGEPDGEQRMRRPGEWYQALEMAKSR